MAIVLTLIGTVLERRTLNKGAAVRVGREGEPNHLRIELIERSARIVSHDDAGGEA